MVINPLGILLCPDILIGVDNTSTVKQQESPSLVNPLENSSLVLGTRGDSSLAEDNPVRDITVHEVKRLLANPLANSCQLPLRKEGTTSGMLPKDPKKESEMILNDDGEDIIDIGVQSQWTSLKNHNHETVQTLQITHFPIVTNSGIETTTVKDSNLLSNFQSANRYSLSSFRSNSVLEIRDVTSPSQVKPRSQSLANDVRVNVSTMMFNTPDNRTQETSDCSERQYSIHPVDPKRVIDIGPLFKTGRSKSSFGRTKSLESALRKKSHCKSDDPAYHAFDSPPPQRHSPVLKTEQLEGTLPILGYSESNFSYSSPEIVRKSSYGTPQTDTLTNVSPDRGKKLCRKQF